MGDDKNLLGFRIVSELSNVMIFLSTGGENHHDLALLRVGQQAPSPVPAACLARVRARRLDDLGAPGHRMGRPSCMGARRYRDGPARAGVRPA